MRAPMLLVASLWCSLVNAAEARIVIADGAKTRGQAEEKLAALRVPGTTRLAAGYPRVVASETVKGLNPGLHIVVLGLCPAAERTPITSNGVGMNIQLRHHTFLTKQLKTWARGVYTKVVNTDLPLACPLWLFGEPPRGTQALHVAWSALRSDQGSPDAWVTLGKELEVDGDLDGADYCYSVALERDPKSTAAQDALYRLDLIGARGI